MNPDPSAAPSLFDKMKTFARRTRKLRLAHPDDVIAEVPEYEEGEEAKARAEGRRPKHLRVKLEIKPGAETLDFEVSAISDRIKEQAERLLDKAVAPKVFIEQPGEKPGMPPRQVFAGYNEEDPAYLAELREAKAQQTALVALHGTQGLRDSIPGEDDVAKVAALRDELPHRMIAWLAAEIWNMTYAGGDLADFFTKEGSPESPS